MSSYRSLQFKYMIVHIFTFKFIFTIYGYITNSQRDQLLMGLIVYLVEHCLGITESMGLNPVQA